MKKKNNTWNIRRLVNNSFVPLAQREIILDWRIFDPEHQKTKNTRVSYFFFFWELRTP